MHTLLTHTLMHDRYLSPGGKLSGDKSITQAYHWYQATFQFNKILSKPASTFSSPERDALWGTAALLGGIAFSSIDATNPHEAWPMKSSSPSDLDWLKMSEGKKAIWDLADISRPDSVFQDALPDHHQSILPPNWCCTTNEDHFGLPCGNLSKEYVELFNLDECMSPAVEQNPYFEPACLCASLLPIEINRSNSIKFLAFMGHMKPDFRDLLAQKDPRALLLLSFFYAKLLQFHVWWTWQRALLECQSICIYLESYYGDDTNIKKLLQFPKMMSGLLLPTGDVQELQKDGDTWKRKVTGASCAVIGIQ